uniref:Uncharacterized protein n=2 Tax=Lutzomyia longipalpis TaxID=7200 RepID=A0A1B0CAU2_LUTLO
MSLRDLFQEIKTEQSQEVFLPKTNSIIVKNITEGNLDLHGVFPSAVDFVLQAKPSGITAVVTFRTPEEASDVAKTRVKIGDQEILPTLLLEASSAQGKRKKPQKATKGSKKISKGKKIPRKEPEVFEKVGKDDDYGKKLHLWKLVKNVKMKVLKNWDEIKQDAKLEVNPNRKNLLNKEIFFMRCLLKLLETHKWCEVHNPEYRQQYPHLRAAQKDPLLQRLRDELCTCVQEQIAVIRKVKIREGDRKTEARFGKEITFMIEFQRQLTSKIAFRKKVKKGKKAGKQQK